jgi:hypothetical protein
MCGAGPLAGRCALVVVVVGALTVALLTPSPLPTTTLPPCRRDTDPQGERPLSHTPFAQHWRWLVGKNAFVQPFTVNFGLIGACVCVVCGALAVFVVA